MFVGIPRPVEVQVRAGLSSSTIFRHLKKRTRQDYKLFQRPVEQVPLFKKFGVSAKSLWCHSKANRQTGLVASVSKVPVVPRLRQQTVCNFGREKQFLRVLWELFRKVQGPLSKCNKFGN